MTDCVVCEKELTGRQRHFCSEACKQRAKYQQSKGKRCSICKKPMRPIPTLGGFQQAHNACIKRTGQ